MNIPIFIFSLFLLQIICLFVGRRASKKLDSNDDYFLAGKGVSFFPLMMTLVATQVGGGLVLGSAEEAYRYGWTVILYPLGACLGLFLLAAGVGKRLCQFNVSTVAQLFEVVYRSPFLKKFASALSIISLFMILVAQVIASRKFMLSLGVDSEWVFIAFWAIVVFYTVAGGLKAVVATDIIQASFFLIIFLLCFAVSAWNQTISPTTDVQPFEFDLSKMYGWLFMPLLFMLIEQDMAQRCLAAKSAKIVSWASAGAAVCILVVCAIPIYFGMMGKSLGIKIMPGSSVLMDTLQATTTPALSALFGCAILAAIISTADSLMNAVSANISQDFDIKPSKNNVKGFKLVTCTIGALAFVSSYYFSSIVGMLIQSYELSVSCLFVPVMGALFLKKGHLLSAQLAVLAGVIGFFLFKLVNFGLPSEVMPVLFSLLGYLIGEAIARRQLKLASEI